MKKHFCALACLLGVGLLLCVAGAQVSQSMAADQAGAESAAAAYPVDYWQKDVIYSPDSISAGSHVSIAFDADHGQAAWVSFYHQTDGGLWVAHFVGATVGNCGPDDSWLCEQVDRVAGESRGLYTSIDVHPDSSPDPLFTNWKVGVSYYDATHKSLKYAQYRCPIPINCSWTISTVRSPTEALDNFGQYSSMKFDSAGNAHIAYYAIYDYEGDNFIYSLSYARFAGGSTGNCGDDDDWECDDLDWDNSPEPGVYPSLDIDWTDRIYIAAYDGINQRLSLVTSFGGTDNCGQYTYWFCEVIDDPGVASVGLFPSMAAPQDAEDIPRIAYYDSTNGTLKYAYPRGDSDGNCGQSDSWQCDAIDTMGAGHTWASISLAVDSAHHPMIAYTDVTGSPSALSLGVAEMADGQPYANCGGGSWWCGTLDSGGTFVDEARYVSLGIKPGGLAMIAYSSLRTLDPASYSLKVAYQELWIFLPLIRK